MNVLNPHQLQMFMRPDEIAGYVTGSVDDNHKNGVATTLIRKQRENDLSPGFMDDIRQNGVHSPVVIQHFQFKSDRLLGNGHHRVAASATLEKEEGSERYLPVEHDASYMGSTPSAEAAMKERMWSEYK